MVGKIVGTGSYVPKTIWDNHKIAQLVETSDAWIRERTGIVQRHIAESDTTVTMAVEAAKCALQNAIENGGITSGAEIDAIFVCAVAPEILLPAVACEVQKEIGAVHAFAYDMNAACSGFVFAYNQAVAYMNMGMIKTALIIGSEHLSRITDWTDRGSCILFGDGAGAVVVTAVEGQAGMVMHSDGAGGVALVCDCDGKMKMDGQKVFRFAVKAIPACVEEMMNQMEITEKDVDYFVFHQANQRIIEAAAKRLKVEQEKIPMNIHMYGNTSSASIPILLDEMNRKGMLDGGKRMVMAGFGAGLSWGAGYIIS